MRKTAIIFSLILASAGLRAQNLSDLIISEAMKGSEVSVTDEYGCHCDWIEIFNTSQGTVNFAGCFLTDDPSDLTKCQIPKGYNSTKLGPRQVALLYASGQSAKGVFHLNFTLRKGSTIYLVSNDGRTIIDSLDIPSELDESQSVAKFAHDNKEMVFDDVRPASPSPGIINGKHNQKSRAQMMKETDPHGWTLTIVSVSVVFAALLILFLIYNLSGNIFSGKYKRKAGKKNASGQPDEATAAAIALALERYTASDMGREAAAIAAALHLYLSESVHDVEPGFITIVRNPASDWANKSLTFRKTIRKI